MIFSRLFKAKWQHNDPTIRIEALNEFDLDAKSLEILNQLISQDESELVRKAALLKLNSFEGFLTAYQSNSSKSIKLFANKVLTDALFEEQRASIQLTLAQRKQFVECCQDSKTLERLMYEANELPLVEELIKRINKVNMFQQLALKTKSEAVARYALEHLDETADIEKVAKKVRFEQVQSAALTKLEQRKRAQEKPLAIKKQTQLVLSKLLALKDERDFGALMQKFSVLKVEFDELKSEFDLLAGDEANTFLEKYQKITSQVEKISEPMREAYEAEQLELQKQSKQREQYHQIDTALTTLRQLLTNSVFENVTIDEQDIGTQLHNLNEQTKNSVLPPAQQQAFFVEIEKLYNRLTQLPQIADSVAEATRLISSLSGIALPQALDDLNPLQQRFDQWQKDWQANAELIDNIFPPSIESAYKELKSNWVAAIKPLKAEQKRDFIFCQKKLSELKRLINSGKYRSAFGLNKKLNVIREKLSSAQLQQLERDFTWIDEKISDLNDWETYIATPRKQSLIDEIKQLAETPEQDPRQQANKVKSLRKRWNQLGHAEEAVDESFNQQFNDFCEQAFAPCREFFSALELQREQHLKDREAIIEELTQLAKSLEAEQLDMPKFDGLLQSLLKKWRNAGEVDREVYQALLSKFDKVVKPLKAAINNYHNDNKSAKESLIEEAKEQLKEEDVFAAVNKLKSLQAQWKTIGFSGAKHDNKLWAAFREVNNQAFAKRDAVKSEQREAKDDELAKDTAKLNALLENSHVDVTAELFQLQEQLESLLSELVDKDKRHPLLARCKNEISSVAKKLSMAKESDNKQQYIDLFALIGDAIEQKLSLESLELDERFQSLSLTWQKAIIRALEIEPNEELQLKRTLELEIIAGISSPKAYEKERMETQVEILSQKMATKQELTLEDKLNEWLVCGLSKDHSGKLLKRINAIFC